MALRVATVATVATRNVDTKKRMEEIQARKEILRHERLQAGGEEQVDGVAARPPAPRRPLRPLRMTHRGFGL